MDGVLVIDKPSGLTSHDVVAFARRTLREKRVGHTGTLDPLATGVLPLACGRATRLAQFLAASEKEYEAEIRLGLTTDTYDVTGRELARSEAVPTEDAVLAALETLRGDYLQSPPPYSAKKIAGTRAYELARRDKPVQPAAVPVRVAELELLAFGAQIVRVRLTCSAGFYVRSFAHTLGERLATGAALQALRRTRSGEFGLDRSVTIEALERRPDEAAAAVISMDRVLCGIPAVTVTAEGLKRVSHGREVGPAHVIGPVPDPALDWIRLFRADGALIALGRPGETPGSLHPAVVLI